MENNQNASAEAQAASLAQLTQQLDSIVLGKAEALTQAATGLWIRASNGQALVKSDLEQTLAEIAALQEALSNYRLGLLRTVGSTTVTVESTEGETLQIETDLEEIAVRRFFVNGEPARVLTLAKSYVVGLQTPSKTFTIRGKEFAALCGFPVDRQANAVGILLAQLAEVKGIVNHYEE